MLSERQIILISVGIWNIFQVHLLPDFSLFLLFEIKCHRLKWCIYNLSGLKLLLFNLVNRVLFLLKFELYYFKRQFLHLFFLVITLLYIEFILKFILNFLNFKLVLRIIIYCKFFRFLLHLFFSVYRLRAIILYVTITRS